MPIDPQLVALRPALLELAAGHRMFRSAISDVFEKREKLARLPRLILGPTQDEPRVATVARLYLGAVDGTFSAATFHEFMQAVQAHEPLNVDELWSVGTLLKFALLQLILEVRPGCSSLARQGLRTSVVGSHQEPAIHQQR